MSELVRVTFDKDTLPDNRLRAIKLYCLGVKQDFPETKTWMDNILLLAGFEPNGDKTHG